MPEATEDDLVTILTVKGATKTEKAECLEEFRNEYDLVTILTVKGATKTEKAECLEEFRNES